MSTSSDTHAARACDPGLSFEVPPCVRILRADGTLEPGAEPPFDDARAVELYRHMLRARIFDARLLKLQRQGRVGTFAPGFGQEAAQIGSISAVEKHDWFVPSFREIPAALYRGAPFRSVILYCMGFEEGSVAPPGARDLPVSIPVGGQSAHAVGLAWAMRLQGDPGIALVYFGDGATSEGIVHESMNFAGALRAPVVFFCQNNQWAISTPRRVQTASETIAQKAIAHGLRGVQVDGNDLFAVHAVVREAASIARETGMSTLVEAITFRRGVHTTADDPRVYRTEDEERAWERRDPVDRVRTWLTARGLWSDADEAAYTEAVEAEIAADLRDAEAFREEADPMVMFDHAIATPDPYLARQRAEAEEAFDGRVVIAGATKPRTRKGSDAVVGELEIAED